MNNFALFIDVSVNPQRMIGIGGYLLVPAALLESEPDGIKRDEVSAQLKINRFEETSSTRLEVQTLLWALEDSHVEVSGSLKIYTDSQCVAGLLGRRSGLERSDFISKRSGQPLANEDLYRAFYAAYDQLGFRLIKVQGHSRTNTHDTVHRIFSYVDQGVRKALKFWLDSHGSPPTHSDSGMDPLTT